MPFSIDRPFSSSLGINLGGKLMSTSSWRSSWRKEIFTSNWYKGREKFAAIERITLKEFSFAKINQSHMLVNPSTTNLAFIPLESIHLNHLLPNCMLSYWKICQLPCPILIKCVHFFNHSCLPLWMQYSIRHTRRYAFR